MMASSVRASSGLDARRLVREASDSDRGRGEDAGAGARSARRAASREDSSCSSERSCSPADAHHM